MDGQTGQSVSVVDGHIHSSLVVLSVLDTDVMVDI